ncbi:hypothetical protein Vqi01_43400 [Micromonospora qiuiae]|uniref:Uncharacterized protein n=1 Tax=Micromonospora qiuiae TaxID=502268 RepID=A0ABQ4JFQ8_9ACTN|nr:hypothetical protein [Micromonospora qiuiae]GIJ29178.1 hypothetical protein Vqi01_43400 [Micromonospora qiuiae]
MNREAYRECEQCRGAGSVAYACHRCKRRGRRRAQLVLSVANLDTGAVASHNVVPGGLDPESAPTGWVVRLSDRVRELAASVGASVTGEVPQLWLPSQWRPDLPALHRLELEAQAIVGWDNAPWRLFVGRCQPAPPVDPADRLVRLCALADLLLLDLVIEVRRQGWNVRYEVPGSPAPMFSSGRRDLPEALAATDVADALAGLAERGRDVAARLVQPDQPRPPVVPAVDVDQLERRILADCVDPVDGAELPGAQAIWRDGRWWHTSLRDGEPIEDLVEQPTGQVLRRVRVPLRRGFTPPDPSWLGPEIGWRPCPDCVPGSRLRSCDCRLGGRTADVDCPHCRGAGLRPSALACFSCDDTHRLYDAVVITLTDLRHRVVHLAWHAGTPEEVTLAATQPGGKPVVRLPDRYRLAAWAPILGVRPEDLAEADGGHEIEADLLGGYVTLPWAGADPVAEQVRAAGRGQPAGRLIVSAVRPDAPPLTELIRLALGLDLALEVSVCDLRHHAGDPLLVSGLRWSVHLRNRDAPVSPDELPYRPTLEAALAWCVECLTDTVAEAVPADSAVPIPVPAAAPNDRPADPVPVLLRLAARHAGQTLTVRFTRAGCTLHLHHDEGVHLLAEATDLHELRLT